VNRLRIPSIGAFVAFVLVLSSCEYHLASMPITIDGHTFQVEIADTPQERERGLMFRKSMPDDHGMLFIFSGDQQLSFWMKNTEIPLAVAYVSEDGTIREIHHMKPHSLEPIESDHSVRYALELNDGTFAHLGISVGDKIVFSQALPQPTG
jgi:uncharacterized protein